MKRSVKVRAAVLICFLLLPCVTAAVAAAISPVSDTSVNAAHTYDSYYTVIVDGEAVDSEKFLVWALAGYMEPASEIESLRAMAVILRTNLRKMMGDKNEIEAAELGFFYYTEDDLKKVWGKKDFISSYRKMEKAVDDTKGAVILNKDGKYIDALFHRVSAGYTRNGEYLGKDYGYLCPAESIQDIKAENYMQIAIYGEDTVIRLLEEYFDIKLDTNNEPLIQSVKIVTQNGESSYVDKVIICGYEFDPDEFATALKLQSPAFFAEEYEGKIRFFVTGIGHGFGMSIYGADFFAGEGYGFKDILLHYYANIIIKYE